MSPPIPPTLRGLLGVTLDPNFSTNHYVYVFYTATSPTVHNRVSRYTANGDVAVPGSQKVLLDLPALGNTGAEATTAGPCASAQTASSTSGWETTPHPPMRSHSTPSTARSCASIGMAPSPADNPFFDSTSGDRRAIWALGLRQPYSLDVQSGTSKMYVNDVGED